MFRVLLVDDEEILLRATESQLRVAGIDVEVALGGEQALALLAEHDFDAALIDVMMPRMSGIELIRRARASAPNLQIVLTSSFELSRRQIERLDVGEVGFVSKPASLPKLLEALGLSEVPARHSSGDTVKGPRPSLTAWSDRRV